MSERYGEPGSSWWPVLWGPVFALAGGIVEATTGPVHLIEWVVVGVALAGAAALWVRARRRVCSVRLTGEVLHQGQEELAVARIAEIDDVGPPLGARVLGGGWSVPKRCTGVPLKLRDGSVVLAWARDPDALRGALRPLVEPWQAEQP